MVAYIYLIYIDVSWMARKIPARKRVTTVRDKKTGKVIRRTTTTSRGTTTHTYSKGVGQPITVTHTGKGAETNPANVKAGIKSSSAAMTKAAQTTATSAEIATYQKTGTSPAQIRVAAATQQAKAKVQTRRAEQRQRLMSAPPSTTKSISPERFYISDIGEKKIALEQAATQVLQRDLQQTYDPATGLTTSKLGVTLGQFKEAERIRGLDPVTAEVYYTETTTTAPASGIISSAEKKMEKATSWLDPKETDPGLIRGLKSGTKLATYIINEPFQVGLKGLQTVGRKIVTGTEKASEYISFDTSAPARFQMRLVPSAERELLQSEASLRVYTQARRLEAEESGFVKELLPGGDIILGSTPGYQADIKALARDEGFTTQQTDTLVKGLTRKRQFGEGGEIGATLAAELLAELVGGGLIRRSYKGLGLLSGAPKAIKYKEFTTAFKAVSVAAPFEAMIQLGASKASTAEETTRTERTVIAGGSALIAGTIGGAIATGFAPKTLTTAVYIADPLEKPADILAAGLTKTQAVKVFVPNLGTLYGTTRGDTKTKTTGIPPPTSTTRAYTVVRQPSTLTPTATTIPALTKTLIPTTTITPTPTTTLTPTRTRTPVRSWSVASTTTTAITTPTPTPTPTPTFTPTLTTTTVTTPVATSIFPLLDLGGFSRPTGLGVSIGARKVTKYVPSIEAGLFGIKGTAPKYRTGIQIRPVTKSKKSNFKFRVAY